MSRWYKYYKKFNIVQGGIICGILGHVVDTNPSVNFSFNSLCISFNHLKQNYREINLSITQIKKLYFMSKKVFEIDDEFERSRKLIIINL